jgi:hypothetical protein
MEQIPLVYFNAGDGAVGVFEYGLVTNDLDNGKTAIRTIAVNTADGRPLHRLRVVIHIRAPLPLQDGKIVVSFRTFMCAGPFLSLIAVPLRKYDLQIIRAARKPSSISQFPSIPINRYARPIHQRGSSRLISTAGSASSSDDTRD